MPRHVICHTTCLCSNKKAKKRNQPTPTHHALTRLACIRCPTSAPTRTPMPLFHAYPTRRAAGFVLPAGVFVSYRVCVCVTRVSCACSPSKPTFIAPCTTVKLVVCAGIDTNHHHDARTWLAGRHSLSHSCVTTCRWVCWVCAKLSNAPDLPTCTLTSPPTSTHEPPCCTPCCCVAPKAFAFKTVDSDMFQAAFEEFFKDTPAGWSVGLVLVLVLQCVLSVCVRMC